MFLKSVSIDVSLLDLFTYEPTPDQLPIPTPPNSMVCLYCFYIQKVSTPQEVLFYISKTNTRALVTEKYPVDLCFRTEIIKLNHKHGHFQACFKNQTFILTKMGISQYASVF